MSEDPEEARMEHAVRTTGLTERFGDHVVPSDLDLLVPRGACSATYLCLVLGST